MLAIDADGTIRETISGDKFINDPLDQKPKQGTIELLQAIKKQGHKIYIVTNQGGVAAGHKSLESAIQEQIRTLELFPMVTAVCMADNFLTSSFWFINRIEQQQVWGPLGIKARKPNPGMLLYLANLFNNGDRANWMIGDMDSDEQAADRAGWDYLHIDQALELGELPQD